MEGPKSTDEDDLFFDVPDEFPFYDCPEDFESSDNSPLTPQSVISLSSSSPDSKPLQSSVAGGLRRRRSVAFYDRNRNICVDLSVCARGEGNVDSDRVESTPRSASDGVNVEKNEVSTITTSTAEENGEDPSLVTEIDDGQSSFLVILAELLVKAIGFQFNLLISSITFPFWALYYSLMLVVNPFYIVRLGRGCLIGKLTRLWKLVSNAVRPFVSDWIEERKTLLKYALRFGWGFLWSFFVGSVLVALLILASVISGLIMRYYLVEEPFQLNQALNFDYTKSRPVAFVPITACPTMQHAENIQFHSHGAVRVIPPNYKLQTTVTLTVPESDYNRHLGMFQVRVDFLSENGKSLTSLSRPCMLEFRSEPIRLLLTFFKIIPLVAGYVSESQTIILKLNGYTEAVTPTACMKVTIEQRAEFRAGAGIPEVYNAFLHVESDLPFFKRILWCWRRTIFVWLSMVLFMVGLLFVLVCYGAIMIPRARSRGTTRSSESQ
ncbi:hypothetical protein Cgig2_029381 [Carnegiea gigantea]|uniref:Seipin n=1 Tax=Carnegiea gigantea TaxID=171969 RepID=A0A9Q1KUN1_9CARY|nr:hypothetical protein Cgig2_029381 [Carnegiea gigantea]